MNVIVILCDTLRRDHCGPYHLGRPLNECWSAEAPGWVVPTPNMDRLAGRGTVFTNCYCGSTPCMPARRDIYTGRYEFPWRGWGPLDEQDRDLPREVSGPPNQSIQWSLENGYRVSQLITDHFHLWEQGAGNYHMGYTGFDFIRGKEADCYRTDPVEFHCPDGDRMGKNERHWRNVHFIRKGEQDWFSGQVFTRAADWLRRNRDHENFYLHLDCFDPHEPLDPPEELVKMFDPKGNTVDGVGASWPYAPWRDLVTEEQFTNYRARYAANVVLVDRWLGRLCDAMDETDLWKNTLVILTSDHGTFNGDHGRLGKIQTHQFDACSHIPLVIAHPDGRGERRDQLVQLVDIYPTVLEAVGRPVPDGRHGVSLLPVLEDAAARTRDHAIAGMFGLSVTITDGRWTLHQNSAAENQPLYWYGYPLAKFIHYDLGPYEGGRRAAQCSRIAEATWLSDKETDPNELTNLADARSDKLREMQRALKDKFTEIGAPPEQLQRLGIEGD